jgi:hypothetical protein
MFGYERRPKSEISGVRFRPEADIQVGIKKTNSAEAGCMPNGCALVHRARLYVACFNDTLCNNSRG